MSAGAAVIVDADKVLLFVDPFEVMEPEETDVRPWSGKYGDDDQEQDAIDGLAESIKASGQTMPVEVRKTLDGTIELIAGRRRRRAVLQINAGMSKGETPLKLMCVVAGEGSKPVNDAEAFRHAMVENIHRRGLNPMDYAQDISTIRERFGWEGKKGTKKVSEFLKVSPANVTQYEKLLGLPEEVQGQVYRGELSADDAFKVSKIAKVEGVEKAREVVKAAKQAEIEIISQTNVEEVEIPLVDEDMLSGLGDCQFDGGGDNDNENLESRIPAGVEKGKKSTKPVSTAKRAAAAKSKVISNAVAEVDRKQGKTVKRGLNDVLDWFRSLLGPAYEDNVHAFVDGLVQYREGEIGDKKLYGLFDGMFEKSKSKPQSKPKDKPQPKPKAVKPTKVEKPAKTKKVPATTATTTKKVKVAKKAAK